MGGWEGVGCSFHVRVCIHARVLYVGKCKSVSVCLHTPPQADVLTQEAIDSAAMVVRAEKAEAADAPKGFVISHTKKKESRLHFVGCCSKIPGKDYKVFDVWGDLMPPEAEFNAVCSICFKGQYAEPASRIPKQATKEDKEPEPSSSSPSAFSSSKSDVELRSAIKRRKSEKGGAP